MAAYRWVYDKVTWGITFKRPGLVAYTRSGIGLFVNRVCEHFTLPVFFTARLHSVHSKTHFFFYKCKNIRALQWLPPWWQTGDCISQKTWYYHRTTVKQRRVWHFAGGCLEIEATAATRCFVDVLLSLNLPSFAQIAENALRRSFRSRFKISRWRKNITRRKRTANHYAGQ